MERRGRYLVYSTVEIVDILARAVLHGVVDVRGFLDEKVLSENQIQDDAGQVKVSDLSLKLGAGANYIKKCSLTKT